MAVAVRASADLVASVESEVSDKVKEGAQPSKGNQAWVESCALRVVGQDFTLNTQPATRNLFNLSQLNLVDGVGVFAPALNFLRGDDGMAQERKRELSDAELMEQLGRLPWWQKFGCC